MSFTSPEEVTCACGEVFEAELYQSVTVKEEPDMKELVTGGQLNVVKCPTCGQLVYAERFVLYHDSENELMAFVYPKKFEPQEAEMRASMAATFSELQKGLGENKLAYQPCLVFGMDTLCDLIRNEEDIADEASVVEALCEELKLPFARIRWDAARRKRLPPVLPADARSGDDEMPQKVLLGLRRVLEENPHLVYYREFFEKFEKNPSWSLAESDLVTTENSRG